MPGLFAERALPFASTSKGLSFCGPLAAGEYRLSGAVSSQFITGLLLALPLAEGDSVLRIDPPFESRSYVELTLSVLSSFGIHPVWDGPLTLRIPGGQRYRPARPISPSREITLRLHFLRRWVRCRAR